MKKWIVTLVLFCVALWTFGMGTGTALAVAPIPIHPILLPPAAPTDLSATISGLSITLSWTDNSDNEANFSIERKVEGGTYASVATTGVDETTFTDEDLSSGTKYYYRVCATNLLGESNYSNEVTATTPMLIAPLPPIVLYPLAPTDLEATAVSTSQINLSWTDRATNETGYRVQRREGTDPWTAVTTLAADATNFADTGLDEGTTYEYRVIAFNGAGDSASVTVSAMTMVSIAPPMPPTPSTVVIRLYIDSQTYYVNDEEMEMDTAPIVRDGRTLLPIRYVAEPLGATASWDSTERKVTVENPPTSIEMWIDQSTAYVNGVATPIDPDNSTVVPIVIPPGRTMLPVRFIAENLNCRVEWYGPLNQVTITYPAP